MQERLRFVVDRLACRGELVLPDGPGPHPAVVLAHGLGGLAASLTVYARRFAATGVAAATFDYRHFGASDGAPRQLFSIRRQLADLAAALACVGAHPRVDGGRLALWGTSFGAAHALTLAARAENRLGAVVVQNPAVDFAAMSLGIVRGAAPRRTLRLVRAALRDAAYGLGGGAHYVPLVGGPQSDAAVAVPTPEATLATLQGQWQLGCAGAPALDNRVAPRFMLSCAAYRPIAEVSRIRAPVLYAICEADTVAPAELAIRAARRTPRATACYHPTDHTGIYAPPHLEPALQAQCAFLAEQLGLPPPALPVASCVPA